MWCEKFDYDDSHCKKYVEGSGPENEVSPK